MMSFLGPKGLRAEVTEGIDLEQGVTLAGPRITIGSGPNDTLRLGAADIVPGHLTFERRSDGSGWDYFSSDRGITQTDKGNPRTGPVRPGMWIRLGRETRIDLVRAALPATPAGETSDEVPTTVPMPVALGLLGALGVAALVFIANSSDTGGSGIRLQTTDWVTGTESLTPAIETCLQTTDTPGRAVAATDPANTFWQAVSFRQTDPARAARAQTDLTDEISKILASAHLLSRENRDLEASATLRRLEYVLPVDAADCPILTASQFDLAVLELLGSR